MRFPIYVGVGYLLAVVTPWVIGTMLGYNPEFSGLAFLIALGVAITIGAFIGESWR